MNKASTEQLVALIQNTGDRNAFNELFSRYDTKLRAFLAQKYENIMMDDILQETYVKAFLNFNQFKGQSSFSTWLCRIAFNELLQSRRKISIFQRLKEKWQTNIYRPENYLENHALYIDAERAINSLSSIQQRVFVYVELLGYSHSEASNKLNIPLGSVKTYIKQIKGKLGSEEQ
ncbi:RNA polymerase sigma factor [Aliikangiella sp. G2MR2-5]|uniref:RNA polymerase sigma factor n=1 Tax=Aliikangiella sp. G2MR2-5 TaxID=2788943 RepID=UPI0018A99AD5